MLKKKKQKKQIYYFILFLGVFIVVGTLLYHAVTFFWIGYHNADLCQNEQLIGIYCDLDILELRTDGMVWGVDECYISGLNDIKHGFNLALLTSFILLILFISVYWFKTTKG